MKTKFNLKKYYLLIFIALFFCQNLKSEIPLYTIQASKIIYKNNNSLVIAEGSAQAKNIDGKIISSDFIIYDKLNSIIKTKNNSKFIDNLGNTITAENFIYDLNLKKIIAKKKVKYLDKNNNIFYFSEFEYYENLEKGFGKNFQGIMNDKSSLESKYLEINNKAGFMKLKQNLSPINFINQIKSLFKENNNYTTCENKNNSKDIKSQCPDWSVSTVETSRDSNKKLITHNHAIIKIRNIPVFYTPYFSHPDPTVKRKSGFLTPSTKNFTDLGRTVKTPYFWSINNNSDLTFTPIFYEDENSIFLTEYRKQNENSLIYLDSSYTQGYKNLDKKSSNGQDLNRTNGSRNHIFLKYKGEYENILFDKNEINLSIQRISQKNYLEVNQINTELIKQNIDKLENNISINSYRDNEKLKISSSIYENLNIDDQNLKYQYKIPYIEYNNNFNKFKKNISLSSLFEANNYYGDTKQIIQKNTFKIENNEMIVKKFGLSNNLLLNSSNINYYNENLNNEKPNLNNEIFTTVAIESSIPAIRSKNNVNEIITPKTFVKYTTGSMRDNSSENKVLSYSDVYSIDRLNNINNPETGASLGYGVAYNYNKQNKKKIDYLLSEFSIGQVISDVKKKNMPTTSSLNEKKSNIVGNFNFLFKKNELDKIESDKELSNSNYTNVKEKKQGLNINYNFNISNDFNKILKNDLKVEWQDDKNKVTTSYYELHDIGNSQYLETAYERSLKNNYNLLLGFRKNYESKYTESNYIETNYESDCLKIGFRLAKQFYEDNDLQKSNNLTFFIMLKPFGQPLAPDLTNLINN